MNLIFPAAITDDAQRVANTLEHIYGPVSKTLRGPQKSIDVVLVNQSTQTNGFVAWAPRRSVWFSTPPQNAGRFSGDWYQLLAVHEMRHVVQFDRMRRGLVRLAWLFYGEQGEALAGLLVPPYSGIDNIHAVHLPSGARYQVTSRPLAATHAAVAGDSLLFQEYTVDGYRIAVMPLDPATWTPVEQVADRQVRYYEPLIKQEQGGPILADIPQRTYPVSGYRPLGHLLDVHSWSYSPLPPRYALNLTSSDLLHLSSMSGGIEYNSNESAFSVLGDFSLAAWYPIFSAGGRWGERAGEYEIKTREMEKEEKTDKWTEKSLSAGVELPLNFSRGPWQSSANFSAKVEWIDIADRDDLNRPADDLYWSYSSVNQEVKDVFTRNHNGRFAPLTYQLIFGRSRHRAARDLASAWGQSLQLPYRHTPFAGDYDGTLLSGRLGLGFSGLAVHHSLQLEGGYEWQDPAVADALPYRFASEQPFVRGYDYEFHHRFYQGSVNYAQPLFYPDWNLGTLAYLKRFKMNYFYDYGRGEDDSQPSKIYQSVG